MNINIGNVPKAVLFFILGTVFTFLLFGAGDLAIVPFLFEVFTEMDLYSDWEVLKGIIWFIVFIGCFIATIGMPVWLLFEGDDENE